MKNKGIMSLCLMVGLLVAQPEGALPDWHRPKKPFNPESLVNAHDANKDLVLSFEEFTTLEKNQNLPMGVVQKLFTRFDKNQDEVIDSHELTPRRMGPEGKQGAFIHIFDRWDLNDDLLLSEDEFEEIPGKFRELVFSDLDSNNDGQLSMEELVRSVMALRRDGLGRGNSPHERKKMFPIHLMEQIDADSDGNVTRSEIAVIDGDERLQKLVSHLNHDFDEIDINDDDRLSEEELSRFIARSVVKKRRDSGPPASRDGGVRKN